MGIMGDGQAFDDREQNNDDVEFRSIACLGVHVASFGVSTGSGSATQ